ncbi:MAG: hypothetical protein ACK4KW_05105 [Gemmobacter sp.]
MRGLVLAALMCVSGFPAWAASVCNPGRGAELVVTDVPRGDTLNLRSAPGNEGRVIGTIGGRRDPVVTATGRVAILTDTCRVACEQLEAGLAGLAGVVEDGCRARGRIWYEVQPRRGPRGWSSARFLSIREPGRPPGRPLPPIIAPERPRPPSVVVPERPLPPGVGGQGPGFRYSCQDGDALVMTVGRDVARVEQRDGTVLFLQRVPAGQQFSYSTDDLGGAALRGNEREIYWQAPGRRPTMCYGAR